MVSEVDYVLCGGTFSYLVLSALKEISKRRGQNNGGITEPNCFVDLINMTDMKGQYTLSAADVSTEVSKYKSCKIEAPEWLMISRDDYIQHIDDLVKNDYVTLLHEVIKWADKYLNLQKNGDWLCKALLEMAYYDDSVDLSEKIYAKQDGTQISFDDLIKADEVHVQAVLLGFWHYVLVKKRKNKDGEKTIKDITKPKGEKKSVRLVEDFLGNSVGIKFKARILKVEKVLPPSSPDRKKQIEFMKAPFPSAGDEEPDVREILPGKNNLLAFSDNEIALPDTEYKDFLESEYSAYQNVKTLLFHNEPRDFESIYLCSDVLKQRYGSYDWSAIFEDSDYAYLNRDQAVHDFSFVDMQEQRLQYTLLTGLGGLGKSMMVRHLLLDAIKNYSDYRMLPLLVPLKDYRDSYNSVLDFTYCIFDSFADGISKEDYIDLLRAGRVLLLLDGLDEIKEAYREDFDISLERFVNKYRNNYFVVSSRPNSNFAALPRFTKVSVLPFTKDQAMALINKLDLGKQDEEMKQGFLKELDENLYITHRAYVQNPLLLTIMLLTYKQKTIIPTEMYKFYEKAFDTLFSEHDNIKVGYKREYKTKLKQDKFAQYMAEFCFLSYQEENFDPSGDDCRRYFEEMDIDEDDRYKFEWDDFINDVVNCVCLMYEEGQKYHFIHRSIQEYFCACYFRDLPDSDLADIGEFFENKRTRSNDKTFEMLYAMKKRSVEEMIFIPFLEELFKTDNPLFGPSYSKFMTEIYPCLYTSVGDVADEDTTEPKSFLYGFIAQKNGFLTSPYDVEYPEDIVEYEEFMMAEYVRYDDDYQVYDEHGFPIAEHGSNDRLVLREDIPDDYKRHFEIPDSCGWNYEISLEEVFDKEPYYIELIEWLSSDTNPYKIEFNKAQEYLANLQKQKSEKKESLHDKLKKKRRTL